MKTWGTFRYQGFLTIVSQQTLIGSKRIHFLCFMHQKISWRIWGRNYWKLHESWFFFRFFFVEVVPPILLNLFNDIMVNWWFGARWFEILRLSLGNNPFHFRGSQNDPKYPNHQLAIGRILDPLKKISELDFSYKMIVIPRCLATENIIYLQLPAQTTQL